MPSIPRIKTKLLLFMQSVPDRIADTKIIHFYYLRLCFVAIYLSMTLERLFDHNFVRSTTLGFFQTRSELEQPGILVRGILSSAENFNLFLITFLFLCLCYGFAKSRIWPIVFLLFEFIYQAASSGNMYGHEGFIHQFLILMVIVELGQGRIRSVHHNWTPSVVSGLGVILLKWQLMVLYFAAGHGKLTGTDWHTNDILDRIFLNKGYIDTFIDDLYLQSGPLFNSLLRVVIIGFQILFPFLIFHKLTRKLVLTCGVLFHVVIAMKMGIYSFSFFMISLYLIFYDGECRIFKSRQNSPPSPSS